MHPRGKRSVALKGGIVIKRLTQFGFLVVMVLTLVACAKSTGGSAAISSDAPKTFDFKGRLALFSTSPSDGSTCSGQGGYSDITAGSSVTVYGFEGQVLGTGYLNAGEPLPGFCDFPFTVPDVAVGEGFYLYQVTNRGKILVNEQTAVTGSISATLGL